MNLFFFPLVVIRRWQALQVTRQVTEFFFAGNGEVEKMLREDAEFFSFIHFAPALFFERYRFSAVDSGYVKLQITSSRIQTS